MAGDLAVVDPYGDHVLAQRLRVRDLREAPLRLHGVLAAEHDHGPAGAELVVELGSHSRPAGIPSSGWKSRKRDVYPAPSSARRDPRRVLVPAAVTDEDRAHGRPTPDEPASIANGASGPSPGRRMPPE